MCTAVFTISLRTLLTTNSALLVRAQDVPVAIPAWAFAFRYDITSSPGTLDILSARATSMCNAGTSRRPAAFDVRRIVGTFAIDDTADALAGHKQPALAGWDADACGQQPRVCVQLESGERRNGGRIAVLVDP